MMRSHRCCYYLFELSVVFWGACCAALLRTLSWQRADVLHLWGGPVGPHAGGPGHAGEAGGDAGPVRCSAVPHGWSPNRRQQSWLWRFVSSSNHYYYCCYGIINIITAINILIIIIDNISQSLKRISHPSWLPCWRFAIGCCPRCHGYLFSVPSTCPWSLVGVLSWVAPWVCEQRAASWR